MHINFGCGGNFLPGWVNHDVDVDIRKRLPYDDNSVDAVFAEHVVEHVTPHEAWRFFEECFRILRPAGVVRIAVPSIVRISQRSDPAYERFCFDRGFSTAPTRQAALKAIVFGHGHQSVWDECVLGAFLDGVGFGMVHRMTAGDTTMAWPASTATAKNRRDVQ